MNKQEQYAALIVIQLEEMFQEDANNHIDLCDFDNEKNLKDFFHALANIVPTYIYNKFTNSDESQLEFNHIANRLCFENTVLLK